VAPDAVVDDSGLQQLLAAARQGDAEAGDALRAFLGALADEALEALFGALGSEELALEIGHEVFERILSDPTDAAPASVAALRTLVAELTGQTFAELIRQTLAADTRARSKLRRCLEAMARSRLATLEGLTCLVDHPRDLARRLIDALKKADPAEFEPDPVERLKNIFHQRAARIGPEWRSLEAQYNKELVGIVESTVPNPPPGLVAELVCGILWRIWHKRRNRGWLALRARQVAVESAEMAVLILQYQNGEEKALEKLMDRHAPEVMEVIRPFGLEKNDRIDVEDVVWTRVARYFDAGRAATLPALVRKVANQVAVEVVQDAHHHDAEELTEELEARLAQQPAMDRAQVQAQFRRFLQDLFESPLPLHQVLVYALRKKYKPRAIAQDYSEYSLAQLAKEVLVLYDSLDAEEQELEKLDLIFRRQLEQPARTLLRHRTYQRLGARALGETCLSDYRVRRDLARDVSDWCYAVESYLKGKGHTP
jgi:hypothetical protein